MAFTRNRPTANELLKNSQPLIRSNFNDSDDSFGVDHYKFSDTTANNGFHNQVTTPVRIGGHPVTTTNAIAYAAQDSANVGQLQYSRGPIFNGYVPAPTPLTELHSNVTPIALGPGSTTNVLDFAGLFNVIGTLYAVNWPTSASLNGNNLSEFIFMFNGNAPGFLFINQTTSNGTPVISLAAVASGTILQIKNNSAGPISNVYWTLRFHRMAK